MMNTKIVGIVIAVVVIAVGGWFWFFKYPIHNSLTPTPNTSVIENKISKVSNDQLPKDFPNIPLSSDNNIKVTESFNATTTEGRLQAVRIFQSSKSAAENFAYFNNYVTKNGWKVITQDSSNSASQFLMARNDKGLLTIMITSKVDGQYKSVVTMNFLVNK